MKELFTSKLYYGKFTHRVVISCTFSRNPPNRIPYFDVFDFVKANLEAKKYRTRYDGSTHHRRDGNRRRSVRGAISIYFKDEAFLERLLEKYQEIDIVSVERPLNSAHTEVLETERVLVRKTLFHNKYRYCIRTNSIRKPGMYNYSRSHIEEMYLWHKETFPELVEGTDYRIYRGWNANFFFANPKDAMLMKLVWSSSIESTDRIMLLSELEQTANTE